MFRTMLKMIGATMVASLTVLSFPAPVHAATTSTTDIRTGTEGTVIGTAMFARTLSSDGTETLAVHIDLPAGIDESHVCLSDSPFTKRATTGQCPNTQDATGTTADYNIALGTAYVGQTLYVQVHVVSGEETGFAGWQPGQPFFGNVALAAAAEETPVPAAAVGGIGLALIVGVGVFAARRWRRTSPAAV